MEEIIKNIKMDSIPEFLYKRDICLIDRNSDEMKRLKKGVLEHKHVKKITDLQLDDGSWGFFHGMGTGKSSVFSTERALRRLLNLGLDKDDEPIKRALSYMESYLKDEIELRDYQEKRHDWKLLTKLFVTTWLKRIDRDNEIAQKEAQKWKSVVEEGFRSGKFSEENYIEVYKTIHNPEEGKAIWKLENFYMISIMSSMLSDDIEKLFLEHILSSDKGMYYIYNKNLSIFPDEIKPKDILRIVEAYDIIADYKHGKQYLENFLNWILRFKDEDGLYDFSSKAKDDMVLPLSSSWRKADDRKIDCTIAVKRIEKKIGFI